LSAIWQDRRIDTENDQTPDDFMGSEVMVFSY
jgi:hypothetical protein